MKKINNKGFTLVELLAVLAILIVIMMIALPNISSSIERSKDKENKALQKVIISAGELFISDHKNKITFNSSEVCYIRVQTDLIDGNYLTEDEFSDFNGGCLEYTKSSKTIEYVDRCNVDNSNVCFGE